jgi:hypothetical protein
MSVTPLNPARMRHIGALKDASDRLSREIQHFHAVTVMNDRQRTDNVVKR